MFSLQPVEAPRAPPSAWLPEQQVLLRGPGSQAVAPVLAEAPVDLGVLGQRLDDSGLTQASVPQRLLPQQPVEQLGVRHLHLHGAAPHPQRAAVIHLRARGHSEDINSERKDTSR